MIHDVIKKILEYFLVDANRKNSDSYIKWLRKTGVKVGDGTKVFDARNIMIDVSRPELVEIGDNVFLHGGMTIMTHDWASWCFVRSHHEFYPSHGKIKIGNNVWFGRDVTICKGVTIGDNCIVGIGSIVTKSIPSNSVAVGIPAKVICSYEDYLNMRQTKYVEEALEYARTIIASGREPSIEDFKDDYPIFVDRENYMDYDFPYSKVFSKEHFMQWLLNHKKVFNGFDSFINAARIYNENENVNH